MESPLYLLRHQMIVATVLTVYGIETYPISIVKDSSDKLQQYLPFTVLKLQSYANKEEIQLQQYLPFTVLKL